MLEFKNMPEVISEKQEVIINEKAVGHIWSMSTLPGHYQCQLRTDKIINGSGHHTLNGIGATRRAALREAANTAKVQAGVLVLAADSILNIV